MTLYPEDIHRDRLKKIQELLEMKVPKKHICEMVGLSQSGLNAYLKRYAPQYIQKPKRKNYTRRTIDFNKVAKQEEIS